MFGQCKILSLLTLITAAAAQGPTGDANLQGFTKEGISALNAAMHKWVDDKQGANVVTIMSRNGVVVDHNAYGSMDASQGAKLPVKKDTIFRIASMTKPTVGVAMMIMFEDGKWKLEDPVTKHIPEFASLQVKDASGKLVPQASPMTMAQLVSHSAGFGGQLSISSPTLDGIIPPLIKGNLAFQPGKDWRYGPGVEVQGYLVQKWAGKDLSDFLQERVFQPLGMVDTGFWVDASKVSRVTKLHSAKGGQVKVVDRNVATSKPKRLSPSGGLYSTAEDYWKFCQMVLNGGTFNGKQILKPESVKLMHTNVLEPQVKVKFGQSSGEGVGFGVDFAIVLDQQASNNNMSKESFYWGGAFGTWFWIDPVNNATFIGMIQNQGAQLSGDSSLRQISAKHMYAALRR